MLFWLPGPVRERNLHEGLTDTGVRYPVTTASHDAGNPAEAVWWLHRRRDGACALSCTSALSIRSVHATLPGHT